MSKHGGASALGKDGDGAGGKAASASAARLFDVRRMIGGLFVVYGVILTITGIADGEGASEKAQGLDINLWAGLGMLLVGAVFLLWMKLSPNDAPGADDVPDDRQTGH